MKKATQERRASFQADLTDTRHGTMNGYMNFGCHCPACDAAHKADGAIVREKARRQGSASLTHVSDEGLYRVPELHQQIVRLRIVFHCGNQAGEVLSMLGLGTD